MKPNQFRLSKFLRLLAMLYYEGKHSYLFNKGICRALFVITNETDSLSSLYTDAYQSLSEILSTTTPIPFFNGSYLQTHSWEERAFFCLTLAEWLESKNGQEFNKHFVLSPHWTEFIEFLKTN